MVSFCQLEILSTRCAESRAEDLQSPREAAQLELENIENKGKIYGDPGYISEADNRIQFSGLEPFSLKLLTNQRDEVNWWLERLSTSTYPNLEEKQWIYQYYK